MTNYCFHFKRVLIYACFFLFFGFNGLKTFAFAFHRVCPTPYHPDFSVVITDDGKMGVIDKNDRFVLPPVYDNVMLNAWGDSIYGSGNTLHRRTLLEKYTAQESRHGFIRTAGDRLLGIKDHSGKYVRDKYAIAFVSDNNDTNDMGIPRVRVFDLVGGAEILKHKDIYALRAEITLFQYKEFIFLDFSAWDNNQHETALLDYEGMPVEKVQQYWQKKISPSYYMVDMNSYNHLPVMYYNKGGKRTYFNFQGRSGKSYKDVKNKFDTQKEIEDGRILKRRYNSALTNNILLERCKAYNKKVSRSVIREDSFAIITKSSDGRYGIESKAQKNNLSSMEAVPLTADTVMQYTPNLYILRREGYYIPYSCSIDGNIQKASPKIDFEDITPTDSLTLIATLSEFNGELLKPIYTVEYDTLGNVLSDNRMQIINEDFAKELEDSIMLAFIFANRASELEETELKKAAFLYNKAYELSSNETYKQCADEIYKTVNEQRQEEIRIAKARARAALASLASSLQQMGNTVSQLQSRSTNTNARHRHFTSPTTTNKTKNTSSSSSYGNSNTSSVSKSTSSVSKSTSTSVRSSSNSSSKKNTTKKVYDCNVCQGKKTLKCPRCNGNGVTTSYQRLSNEIVKCTYCGGDGRIKCNGCHGSGKITML